MIMENSRRRTLVFLWVMACVVACGACSSQRFPDSNQLSASESPSVAGEDSAVLLKRIERTSKLVLARRIKDEDAWRVITYCLNSPDVGVQHMTFWLLYDLVSTRPVYLPPALAMYEEKIIRSERGNVIRGKLLLQEYAWLCGLLRQGIAEGENDPALSEKADEHYERVEARQVLDERAKAFVEKSMASKRFYVGNEAVGTLLMAAQLTSSRQWALDQVDAKARSTAGTEARFWRVVKQAIVGRQLDF